ncbi:MAG: YHYH protein [Deltaproteobacteria bacterium]
MSVWPNSAFAFFLVSLLASCGGSGPGDTGDNEPMPSPSPAPAMPTPTPAPTAIAGACPSDTFLAVDGVAAAGDGYAPTELSVACEDDTMVVHSNGIPPYEFVATTPNELEVNEQEYRIPLGAQPAAEISELPLLGTIAVAVNGVPIFGPNEGPNPDPFGDPIVNAILDVCGAHTARGGIYHYHELWDACLGGEADSEQPSPILGWALDGFPIYGPQACLDTDCTDIRTMQSGWENTGTEAGTEGCTSNAPCSEGFYCALTRLGGTLTTACSPRNYSWENNEFVGVEADATVLDQCNGRVGPDGTYRYHATRTFPYVMGCYRG